MSDLLPEHDVRPYSIAQLADRWGCSDSMIRKLINQGQLQTFRIGTLFRIAAAEVARIEATKADMEPATAPLSPVEARHAPVAERIIGRKRRVRMEINRPLPKEGDD